MASRKHPTQRYHKRLWEAAAAWSSFQDVLDICDYILNERIQPSAPIYYSLVTAICVLYPRPFKRSRGIESLSVEFDIAVDKVSGKVTSVHVRSSTNNVMLDADVINTFLQWRFEPNAQSGVTIVVTFTADNDSAYYPLVRSLHATNRGLPVDFKEPIKAEKLWQWFPELYGAGGHR